MLVSHRAFERGADLGLTIGEIADMAYRSAPYTHPLGNARYDDYWFTIRHDEVEQMGVIGSEEGTRVVFVDATECRYCKGTMRTVMVDVEDQSEEILACPRMTNRDLPLCDQ